MLLKLSEHAKKKHQNEKWNAVTIREAYNKGRLEREELLIGATADVLCGVIDGDFVGLILSKPKNGERIVATGFSAPREYWLSV